jgi:hypothetical protein
MKVTKAYTLAVNDREEMVFLNESDRNEMALAFFQEGTYERFMLEYNWYGAAYEHDYIPIYASNPYVENPLVAMWAQRLYGLEKLAMEDIWAYDTTIVEG